MAQGISYADNLLIHSLTYTENPGENTGTDLFFLEFNLEKQRGLSLLLLIPPHLETYIFMNVPGPLPVPSHGELPSNRLQCIGFVTLCDLTKIEGVVVLCRIEVMKGPIEISWVHGRLETDPAFEVDARQLEDRGESLLRRHRNQITGLELVQIPAGFGAAEHEGVFHVPGRKGDREIRSLFHDGESMAGVAHGHHEDAPLPDEPDQAPADGHGVHGVSGLDGQECAFFNPGCQRLGNSKGIAFFHDELLLWTTYMSGLFSGNDFIQIIFIAPLHEKSSPNHQAS